MVISYHASGTPFYCADGATRVSYYAYAGTPICYIDGKRDSIRGGCNYPGNLFPMDRQKATAHMAIPTPVRITMSCTYDTVANTGTVTAKFYNDSTASIPVYLHFAILENKIPYSWGTGMTSVEHCCRDMLPDGNGESVTIAARDSVTRSRPFSIAAGWNENNCTIAAFVQNNSNKWIYQASEIVIVPKPKMNYWGLTFTETSGNINRIVQPNEAVRFYIKAKNIGGGVYNGTTSVSTADPYVTINSQTSQSVAIATGDWDTVLIYNCTISGSCPSPRTVTFRLQFGAATDTMSFNFIVSNQTGLSDNMESDTTKWTHGPVYVGGRDSLHRSTYRSHSATRSWYCGREATHQYVDFCDGALTSIPFVVTPDSSLKYWQYFALENNWDFVLLEIDNNNGNWLTAASYTGTQTTWTQATIPMSSYAGQTIRIRYRFLSDANTIAEGWYLDDVMMPVIIIGVDENGSGSASRPLTVSPNPFRSSAQIAIGQDLKATGVKIYDITGRLVRDLSALVSPAANLVRWDATDDRNQSVPAGLYFVQLELGAEKVTEKVLLLK